MRAGASRFPRVGRPLTALTAVGLLLVAAGRAPAQVRADPQALAQLRSQYSDIMQERAAGMPTVLPVAEYGVAALTEGVTIDAGSGDARGSTDLYVGLQPAGNGFWLWRMGGSEVVYWALDDGTMGPAAVAVGGGQVTEYEFSFGLHADVPNDTLRPHVIVSFYNAPPDPVADATDPVVEPPSPVSSVGWIFDPITLPEAGFYAIRSGLVDLGALGLDFGLDETFYVEILPTEWASYPDGAPILDPDVFAVFTGPDTVTYGTNQDHMWSDLWVLQGGCDPSVNLVNGDGDGFYDHPDEMYDGGCSPYLNQSGIILHGFECLDVTLELSVEPAGEICVGDTVTVTLSMSCIPGLVRGYQAFLSFDPSSLSFVGGSYTSSPFGLHIIDPIAAVGGDLDLAAGIDDSIGQAPTSSSAVLATLTFTALISGTSQVAFRPHDPPTRLSDEFGQEVMPMLVDSPVIAIDVTPPEITCPDDIDRSADAGVCTLTIDPGWATAEDHCDPSPLIEYKRSDRPNWNEDLLDPYPSGATTITWRATDDWGNYAECVQTVTVSAYNELVVDVELSPSINTGGAFPQTLTRCITFELWDCDPLTGPVEVKKEVDFAVTQPGGPGTATVAVGTATLIDVPCGTDYECVTARDALHTLRRTAGLTIQGIEPVQYGADFTGADQLVGGNLNDDFWVDILDFGVLSSEWGNWYPDPMHPAGDTDCTTPYPHADISGNGLAWTEDFGFIQINFLEGHEDNCCGQPGLGAEGGPVTRISVEELHAIGLPDLAAGDLNGDGWLDEADAAAFLRGARPQPGFLPVPREDVQQVTPSPAKVDEGR